MSENRLKELENRALQIKNDIQIAINRKEYKKMINLSLEFKKIVDELKKAKKELEKNDKN